MALTDAARSALVEDMAHALSTCYTASTYPDYGDKNSGHTLASSCMPLIDRVLADRDLDALLTDLGWFTLEGLQYEYGGWWASITVSVHAKTKATRHFRGEGDTPTAAIMAALRAAL